MKRLDFDRTLLEAVDQALLALGESPRQAIYYHLDRNFKLQRKDITKDTDEFSQALNTIFGPGAHVIEKVIIKNLYCKLNLSFREKNSFEFIDCISVARRVAKRKQQHLKVEKRKRKRRRPIELK